MNNPTYIFNAGGKKYRVQDRDLDAFARELPNATIERNGETFRAEDFARGDGRHTTRGLVRLPGMGGDNMFPNRIPDTRGALRESREDMAEANRAIRSGEARPTFMPGVFERNGGYVTSMGSAGSGREAAYDAGRGRYVEEVGRLRPQAAEFLEKPVAEVGFKDVEELLNKEDFNDFLFADELDRNIQEQRSSLENLFRQAPKGDVNVTDVLDLRDKEAIKEKMLPEYGTYKAAYYFLDQARQAAEAGRNNSGALEGLGNSLFDERTWNPGTAIGDASELIAAINKYENGLELSPVEQALLDAAAIKAATEAYYSDKLSGWYKAGEVVGATVPYMLEFALTGGMSSVGTAAKAGISSLAKWAAKRLPNMLVKGAEKVATRIVPPLARGAAQTATVGLPRVMADAENRAVGDIKPGMEYEGRENVPGFTQALGDAALASFIDNTIEITGVGPLGRVAGKVIGAPVRGLGRVAYKLTPKVGKRIADRVMTRVSDIADTRWAQNFGNFIGKTQWHGTANEFAEEMVAGTLNSLAVGDQTLGEVWSADNMFDTFLGVALMGGTISGVNTIGTIATGSYKVGARERLNLTRFADEADVVFDQNGHLLEWRDLRNSLSFGNMDDVKRIVKDVYNSDSYSQEEKIALLKYAAARVELSAALGVKEGVDDGKDILLNLLSDEYRGGLADGSPEGAIAADNELTTAEGRLRQFYNIAPDESVETFISGYELDEEGQALYNNYRLAKARFEGESDAVNAVIEEDYKRSDDAIDARSNNGNVFSTTFDGEDVFITGGDVVLNEDGTIDYDKSSDILYILQPDGTKKQIPADRFNDKVVVGNAEELKTEGRAKIDERWRDEIEAVEAGAQTENGAPTGDNVAPVELPEVPDFFRLGGKNYSVASRNADGSVDVMADGKRETLPAGTDYSSILPTDKKGDISFTDMPVERTHEYFVQRVTNDRKRAEMIENNRKKAEAERKRFDKEPDAGLDPDKWEEVQQKWEEGKRAAQAKVDYWNEVAKREEDITRSRMKESYESVQPSEVVEMTPDEFIANHLPKITPESFKRETGLSNVEQQKLVGLISNEGVTVEQAAESVLENYDSELRGLGFTGDVQDVRNMIIDVLGGGNPRSYAKSGLEQRRAENVDLQRAQMEAIAVQLGFETIDDMIAYEESVLPRIVAEHRDFDETEYYNNLAENYENDTTRESESAGRGGELLQGEQSVPAGGTPVVGQRREGGAVSNDVQGGGQNGVAQEEVPVNELVGKTDNSTLSQTSDQVAEGDAPGQSGVYSLSELTDNEGNRFYQKNGSIDLWDLSPLFERARRQNAPIRLTERNIDHILDEHKKELGDSEESVLKFLDDVFSTAKVLRKARSGGIFVVVENTKTDKAAIIRLYPSKYGDYYNVESAGYYRKNKWKDSENVIAELSEPTQSVTASDVSKPQVPEKGGKELLNAETATTSASEDTTQSANSQENAQKSGEIAESTPEIQEPRSVEEMLDNGDKRITNYNSRGEVATVATERDGKVVSVDSYDEGVLFEHTEYDGNGKASLVTRYDKQGNVVGTQKYVNGIESKAFVKETMRTAPLRARAEKWMKDTGVPVRLIGIGEDITNSAARRAIEAGEKVSGWIDNDEVVLYLPNIRNAKEIDETFVHEVVAHKGLKALMGEDFDALCDKVWDMMSEEQRAYYLGYPGVNGDTRKAADEFMAHLAEGVDLTDADKTIWNWIVDAVRALLAKSGFKLSNRDIENLIKASYANLRSTEQRAESKEGALFRTTFHGSGAQFDRFDHSFMGTGEGAQAFGWGTYVTEVEGIGRTYATMMRDKAISDKHRENAIINNLARQVLASNNGDKNAALEELRNLLNESWSDKKRVKAEIKIIETGKFLPESKVKANLYTVEIPDDNGSNYLHWEDVVPKKVETAVKERLLERLSEGQGEAYKSDLKQELDDVFRYSDFDGASLYKNISAYVGGDKQASLFLSDMGFVGISYPANATTGGRADGARNYVIFNENDAEIKDKTMFRKKDCERRQEKRRINDIIDTAAGFVTVGGKKQATKNRLKKEVERKQLAKEMYSSVLKGGFNDVTLSQIDKFIEDATPANPFGRRISQRLPQRMERALRQGARTNAVDALFSRISESAVPANERFSEAGRREIEERKKELLKGWAIATGNWHTDLKEFTDDTEPIGEGKDSKVYSSKDGRYVIKASKGKPYGKRFRPDIDNIALFNDVFRDTRYEILGYGEIDGEFVRILQQPIVDFAQSTPLTSEERREYMQSLGFEPLNDANTAFADGEIVIADLQKGNVVRDAAGNISVIDADAKLHTKDVGGDYTYPPVEEDLPEDSGTRFRIANENQDIFVSNAQRAVEGIQQNKATAEQWIAMLKKNGGLKAGEEAWLGLEEWLNEKQGAVTKQEILDFIGANKIQIEEVEYEDLGKSIDYELAAVEGNLERARRDLAYEEAQVPIAEKWLQDSQEEYDSFLSTANRLKTEYGENSPEYRNYIFYDSYTDVLANAKRALENAKSDVEYRRQQIAELEKAVKEKQNQKTRGINRTRLDYTTDGLENKREIALTVPTIEPYNASDEVHFGDAGNGRAVAWVRFGETTDSEGNRVLVIDEIQSKRHQDAREKGYKNASRQELESAVDAWDEAQNRYDAYNAEMAAKYGTTIEDWPAVATDAEIERYEELYNEVIKAGDVQEQIAENFHSGVPAAPFEKNWHELAMKRMLRLAAEEGFDKVAWTTGEQQAQRYDIGAVVNRIESNDTVDYDSRLGVDLVKQVVLFTRDGNAITLRLTPEGIVRASSQYNGHHISDIVGKELGNRIMTETDLVLKEQDLRIGGEGMKGFYDKMLPSFVQKYTKKWGAKVGEVTMPNLSENNTMWSVDVTPEMQESVMQGQTMFRMVAYDKAVQIADEFANTHKGATKRVVISKGKEALEQQMRDAGFTDFSIEVALKNYEGEENPTDGAYYVSSDGIVIYDAENLNATLWHENAHRAIHRLLGDNLSELQRIYNEMTDDVKDDITNKLKAKSYSEGDFPEEAVCYFVEEAYKNGLLNNGYSLAYIVEQVNIEMKDFANFAQELINYIDYGRKGIEREGSQFAGKFHIGQQLPERNGESYENGAGADATEGATEPYSDGREDTRFRTTEEVIDRQEKNEADIARFDVSSLGERLNIPVRVAEAVPGNRRNRKGWLDNGVVTVALQNVASAEEAAQTVIHVAVGHKGLSGVLGERFNELLDGVYKGALPKVKRAINDRFFEAIRNGRAITIREATERVIADSEVPGVKELLRGVVRDVTGVELPDGELRYLLWKNVHRGADGVVETILDRAKEAETGTGDVRFRKAESVTDAYNRGVKGFKNSLKEGWYDEMRSIKVAQEAIENELGRELLDSENVYLYANHLPSINKNKKEVFDNKYLKPFIALLNELYKVKVNNSLLDQKTLERYANAKHGIERNREMAVKRAMTEVQDGKRVFNEKAYEDWSKERDEIRKKALPWGEEQRKLDRVAGQFGARIKDYSGLTAIFDPEGNMKYSQIAQMAYGFVVDVEFAAKEKINEFWKLINGMTRYSLNEAFDSGLMSEKVFKHIGEMYRYYVPLRGFTEQTAEDFFDYVEGDHSPLNAVVKTAQGRTSEAENIFATILNMANSAIVQGSKNRLKQRLLNLALRGKTDLLSVDNAWYKKEGDEYFPVQSYPDDAEGFAEFERRMKEAEKNGEVTRHRPGLNIGVKVTEKWNEKQHAVRVKRNGKEYVIWVNGEPKLANAVNGLLRENFDNTWVGGINRFRAKMVTQYSPTFVFTNLLRDVQSASMIYAIRRGSAALGRFEGNVFKNLPKMMSLYKKHKAGTLDVNVPIERYFKEFLENGGETGYTEMITIEEYDKRIKKLTKDLNIMNATGRGLNAVGEMVDFANRCVENLCRFSAYQTSREMGVSILKSIEDAKEVSVNFNRKGSGAMGQKWAKAFYMFLNPAVQSLAQRILLWKKYPKKMSAVLAGEFIMGAAMPTLYMIISAAIGDEDELEGNYFNLSDYRRRSNICIPVVDGVLHIPLSHEARVAYGLGELITSTIMGHEEFDNFTLQAFNVISQALPLNPMEGWNPGDNILESLAYNLAPDAIKPIVEAGFNRDFAGNKIHNRSDFNEHLPEYMRGKRGTAGIYKVISELLSGREIYGKSWADELLGSVVNPSVMEHLVRGYLGGAYTFADNLFKTGAWVAGYEEFAEFRNVPIASSFYTSLAKYEDNPEGSRTRRDWEDAFRFYSEEVSYYNNKEKAAKAGEKYGEESGALTLEQMERNGELVMIDIFNDGNDRLKELYGLSDAARRNGDFDRVNELSNEIYAEKRNIVSLMEQLADNPVVGYTFKRNKIEGPYGERETYGDVRDANIINDMQAELEPVYEEHRDDRQGYEREFDLWDALDECEDEIGKLKRTMKNYPEEADECMTEIRELRAEAIGLINNYRNNE